LSQHCAKVYLVLIPVLDPRPKKNISPVLNLRAKHVGAPSKVTMTMTTSTADYIPPNVPHNQTTVDKCSSTLEEPSETNSSTRGLHNANSATPTILRKIPTGNFYLTAANADAVVDHVDDNDGYPTTIECTAAIDYNFIQDWHDFITEFEKSPTYERAHTSACTTTTHVVHDDDDDARTTNEHNAALPPDSYADSLRRLNQVLQELEQVNVRFRQMIDDGQITATNVPPFLLYDDAPQQPEPSQEPQRECSPQRVLLRTPPPEPDPAVLPLQLPAPQIVVADTQQQKLYPEPPRECAPQSVIVCSPPPAPDPVATPLKHQAPSTDGSRIAPEQSPRAPLPDPRTHCRPTRHSQSTLISIPNWAKPAVPPPTPMVGVVYAGQTHWPPPRPPKPAPFKKKPRSNLLLRPVARKRILSVRPSQAAASKYT